ncbi:DUF4345 domain-containing protein [Streptomyces sp. MUM 203J]|uniref:DUF4345 domain-containing protein n=1 Tax=Streptomyces sp. MUM 203J TaxID=2791990 RepID=UPI001F042665|nr:DUF4345 domain-containing protein [Streptomyces sp. MUM 203J]MCH0543301.1 DUF4345 domain-containing protein [Streptomyces sp. MUM 203J]
MSTSHRAFRSVLVLLGLVIVGTALADITAGPSVLPGSPGATPTLDSNYRFFAGIWCALGVVLLAAARHAGRHVSGVRVVCGAVFLGGLARTVSYLAAGAPHPLFVAGIGVELLVPPLLLLWSARVPREP